MWPVITLCEVGVCHFMFPVLAAITIFILGVNAYRQFFADTHIPIRDGTKTHCWKVLSFFSQVCYCSICDMLLVSSEGYYCDCCGICADARCVKAANRKLICKKVASSERPPKHHWVRGNLLPDSYCDVCEEKCVSEQGLATAQCCWCHRAVHAACQTSLGEICDFGRCRSLIVPPFSVQLKQRGVTHRLRVTKVTPPGWPNWSPLIVVGNCRSGNNDAGDVLSLLRRTLNPAQVVDLATRPPEAALEWCPLLGPEITPRLLVAGGDGTVTWLLSTIHRLGITPVPAVGIMPLGTGNDLSRILGWGSEQSASFKTQEFLLSVERAMPVQLDRWQVDVRQSRQLVLQRPTKSLLMYNYLSVGVDAQVALDFHRTRNSLFNLFSSRLFNKMLYLVFGTQQVVERGCRGLEQKLEVYLDGRRAELPSIESVVVLNIPSWGAGVSLWDMGGLGDWPAQSYNDSLLEVVCIFSSFHIAQLQVGLSQPHRLGQAAHVRIVLKAKTAVQVDGEPWMQPPAEINITYVNKAMVLKRVLT